MSGPTSASTWYAASGAPIEDRLLEWPPDVFALTDVVLARAEGFRYVLSQGLNWPPSHFGDWAEAVAEAGRRWSAWAEDRTGAVPDLVATEWSVLREGVEVPLEHMAVGDHRVCEALLTLHAIADEACAGLGLALDTSDAAGTVYRARGRELLARTGSLARIDARLLRVLPKVISPPKGRLTFSRYACVQGPGIDARWHKIPARHRGTDLRSEYATILLLPWPLRVRASDFHVVEGSVQRLTKDPYGFFEFAPAEGLDLDLLDRVLVAAREEAGSVDVVLLPESAIDEGEIGDLETLLERHGVISLLTGVRQPTPQPGQFPNNWLHMGFNPRLEKGGSLPSEGREPWLHLRQNKHHRWSLDENQVEQYHLGAALHPHIRWWEAMDVPHKAIQFVEVAELVLTALVCEDLAHNDEIAQLIRSIAPTCVINLLLDGPQLTSRWTARYASVLADDPGSAVLTLTSYGMVERSRPHGRDGSRVVGLWKDPTRGIREIPLDPDAQGVLLTLCADRATRYSADLRWPIDNSTSCYCVAVRQVRASSAGSGSPRSPSPASTPPVLELDQLTILTAWAEAVSEAAAYAPERLDQLLADAGAGATWRSELGLPEPSDRLADALESLRRVVHATPAPDGALSFDALLTAAREEHPGEITLDRVVRRSLLSMLEERRTRQTRRSQ